jgi:hypothetical protein
LHPSPLLGRHASVSRTSDSFRRKLNGNRMVDAVSSEMAIERQGRGTEGSRRGAEAPRRTGKEARGPRLRGSLCAVSLDPSALRRTARRTGSIQANVAGHRRPGSRGRSGGSGEQAAISRRDEENLLASGGGHRGRPSGRVSPPGPRPIRISSRRDRHTRCGRATGRANQASNSRGAECQTRTRRADRIPTRWRRDGGRQGPTLRRPPSQTIARRSCAKSMS